MSLLTGIFDTITGGLGGQIFSAIEKYFPPDMTAEQKANIQLATQNLALQKEMQLEAARSQAEKDINDRIAMYEGTASDLKTVPYLGALMLFLRGAQRPIWGFATIYLDYWIFSGGWELKNNMVSNAFWIINFLVLGFLFGERAVMNIMPFFIEMTKSKTTGK